MQGVKRLWIVVTLIVDKRTNTQLLSRQVLERINGDVLYTFERLRRLRVRGALNVIFYLNVILICLSQRFNRHDNLQVPQQPLL